MSRRSLALMIIVSLTVGGSLLPSDQTSAQLPGAPKEVKIGVVSFLSGPAAPHSGIPTRQGAELLIEVLNAGQAPPPYNTRGIGGVPIRAVYTDEAGPADKQVTEFRRLVLDERVNMVVGYISSANCLAIAPVGEELKTLTVFSICGTQRVFEEADYKYVFRTRAHQIIDALGIARYVLAIKPDLKTIAGINQDYAWGRDSWATFSDTILRLKPDVRIVDALWPKLFAGDYSTEITKLLAAKPEVIFSSLWGGDLETFVGQGTPRRLFEESLVVLTVADNLLVPGPGRVVPVRTVFGARGLYGPLTPDTPLSRWFGGLFRKRHGYFPIHDPFNVAASILGAKAAFEKAIAAKGRWPAIEDVIKAFEYLEYESAAGPLKLTLGKGHQAVEPVGFGIVKKFDPATHDVTLEQVKTFRIGCVNPPPGVKSLDWIRQGFPGAVCP